MLVRRVLAAGRIVAAAHRCAPLAPMRALSSGSGARAEGRPTEEIERLEKQASAIAEDVNAAAAAEEAGMDVPGYGPLPSRRRLSKAEQLALADNIPLQREPLFQPRAITYPEKMLRWYLKAVGTESKEAQMGVNADAVWRSIEEQATQDAWFEALGLERTFMTEHALIAMHVWLLHKRHILDFWRPGIYCGRLADQELFNRLWKDTELRIRHSGTRKAVNHQLELAQKVTFLDFFEYDTAILMDDDNMELSAAVFKSVFQADENADIEAVVRLADWLSAELANIMTQPKEDVYRGWITWSPALGETREDRLARQRSMFEGEWREKLDVDGTMYFFNTRTTEVQRECPTEGLYERRRFALAAYLRRLANEGKVPEALVNPRNLRSIKTIEEGRWATGAVVIPEWERQALEDAGAIEHEVPEIGRRVPGEALPEGAAAEDASSGGDGRRA